MIKGYQFSAIDDLRYTGGSVRSIWCYQPFLETLFSPVDVVDAGLTQFFHMLHSTKYLLFLSYKDTEMNDLNPGIEGTVIQRHINIHYNQDE